MSTNQRIHSGKLFNPDDPALKREQEQAVLSMYEYNATKAHENDKRQHLLAKMFAEVGRGCYVKPPFHATWGGRHMKLGNHVYINFNLTAADDTYIYIGDYTMIGPNVTLATAGHPVLPELRKKRYQYNLPIHIGKNCWLGAGVIVNPGITIGDNSVIGSGAVVTKDIPANVVALGTPCKAVRKINEQDRQYYYGQMKINPDLLD